MSDLLHDAFPGHEVNLVFARGLSLSALTAGLRGLDREPLAEGEAGGWAWAVHDMVNVEIEDWDDIDYRRVCPQGAEVVVFVTEPCSAKAHGPGFDYLRDGKWTLSFSFEDLTQRMGDNPDYMSQELLAAKLIGPESECDKWETEEGHDCCEHEEDREERIARAIAQCFALPSPPLALAVTAK
ncbi:hypothetical protein E6R18_14810 [Streptomyces sp. A1277]|uniref:hypothetical protein n=1 Tax=Streptomyces sp. A1277 TaxID=2563103 RepID=UPI0010A21DA1|nr:hypothetical protein [Streptomyces sp. A1277]THA32165.1 hypothetical protein E6R18_14810 [Streptomyces sp. A1277]